MQSTLSIPVNHERVQQELEKSAEKYHIIGAWIAIIFDPIFVITDYINIPASGNQLLFIRLIISAITFTVLRLRHRLHIKSNTVVIFIPFVLISLQNAYTFSLISDEQLLGHCLNYIALLIGGGMFILWSWRLSLITLAISALASAFFISQNGEIIFHAFLLNGGLLLMVVGAFMFVLIRARYNLTLKEIVARLQVEEINKELTFQKEIVEDRNYQITSSIRYAQRIQNAILGSENALSNQFVNSFVFFRPKDILSGDFYWFYEDKAANVKIVVAADCTGHGVPGALTTVLGCAILNDVVVQKKVYSPDHILKELDLAVMKSFSTDSSQEIHINDGMDISILVFKEDKAFFAAAKNPLYIVRNSEVEIIKGSKFAIGSNQYRVEKVFELHTLDVQRGDKLYIFSDGFQDQTGKHSDQKFMTKRFRELLLSTSSNDMATQGQLLKSTFEEWKEDASQTDDVLVIGIEI